jgi:hypothetical protein
MARREQIYTLLALAWMLLALYGMTSSFVAEPWLKSFSIYLAVPVALVLFVPIVRDRHPANKLRNFGIIKRSFFYLFFLVCFYGFSWSGLALGGPALITQIFGQQRIGKFTVIGKSDGVRKRRDCDYSIQIKQPAVEWHAKVCVAEDFWRSVSPGDTSVAKGKYSSLGGVIEAVVSQ